MCEYCNYRGRRCVYPDDFQEAKDDPVPQDVLEIYLNSSLSSTSPFEDEIFSGHRRFTFQIVLDSTANLLELLRFELRILRFFSDVCVPYMTYNVNKRHVQVWEMVVPKHVAASRSIKSAALAMGCLHLLPLLGMETKLDQSLDESQAVLTIEAACEELDITGLICDSSDEEQEPINLYQQACLFFSEAVKGIHEAIANICSPETTQERKLYYLTNAALTNYLILGFLLMQPWRLLPLVHFPEPGEDPRTDVLGISTGFKTVVFSNLQLIRLADFGELFYMDELNFSFRRRVKIVDDLRDQFNEYLRGIAFSNIDGKTSVMINDIRNSLNLLEKVMALSIRFNYPVTLFKWLTMTAFDITAHIRAKEPFALRLLFVYACICVHCKCWVFECNIWRDYIIWYRRHCGPLCEFDRRLYHYITRRIYIDGENFKSLKDFDVWSSAFDYFSFEEDADFSFSHLLGNGSDVVF